jgi:general stress protein CsbA
MKKNDKKGIEMNKKKSVIASSISLLSSGVVFLGIVGCCGLPILASVLAWVGIGATQIEVLSDYQNYFIGIAVLSLLYGFYVVYFNQTKKRSSSNCCDVHIDQKSESQSCCSLTIEEKTSSKPISCCDNNKSELVKDISSSCCNEKDEESKKEESITSCCGPKESTNKFAKIMLWIGVLALLSCLWGKRQSSSSAPQVTTCCPTQVDK